jgi:hypothetical protein
MQVEEAIRGSVLKFECPEPVVAADAKARMPVVVVESSPWSEEAVRSGGCWRR